MRPAIMVIFINWLIVIPAGNDLSPPELIKRL